MKLPRFLRTKNGVFRFYLFLVVAAYSALFAAIFTVHSRRISASLQVAQDCRARCDDVLGRVTDIRNRVESLVAAECRGSVGGSRSESASPVHGSGLPEPEPDGAPIAEPQVLGIGQNGRYAYADIRYPDGQVYRQYTRLPEHLRRK